MKIKWLLYVVLCTGLLLGCSGSRRYSELPSEVVDYTKNVYQIGVGDQLNVMVWRNADLSVTVPVRPDGKISVPLAGDVFAAGKSAPALAAEIASVLKNYIRSPQVTIIIVNANSTEFISRVRITGAVQNPTSLPFRKGMTVLDLVLLSGGVTEFAKSNKTNLYRQTQSGVEIHAVYLDDILGKGDIRSNYTLMPSDIITVPEKLF